MNIAPRSCTNRCCTYQETGIVRHQTHERHGEPPEKNDAGEEDTRCQTLEQDVGDRLSQGVGHEEDPAGDFSTLHAPLA